MNFQLIEETNPATQLTEEVIVIQLSILEASELAAQQAATTATEQAGIAADKAGEAADKAGEAAASATAAGASASNAGTSATNSATSATLSQAWAESPTEPGNLGTKSSKTWSEEAQEARDEIQVLLANFFDPAIIALNSRIIAEGATLVRKLYIVQIELGQILNEI